MGLLSDLGQGPVALDSSIFIYFIEEHPLFLPVVEPVFASIAARDVAAVTSSLTLLEVLVRPLRANLRELATEYEQILTRSSEITLIDSPRSGSPSPCCSPPCNSRLEDPQTHFTSPPPSNRAAASS